LWVSDAARRNSSRASAWAQLVEEVASHAREQVVVLELGDGDELVGELQPDRRAEGHRQRNRPIHLHDR
jgi:hypothetical protein